MASEKNITMRQYNGVDYDTLYPKTKVEQVEGLDGYLTKDQTLSSSVAALYGLSGTDAIPNNVFNQLYYSINGTDGKLYQWNRWKYHIDTSKTGSTSNYYFYYYRVQDVAEWQNVTISRDGTVYGVGEPTIKTTSNYTTFSFVAGRYYSGVSATGKTKPYFMALSGTRLDKDSTNEDLNLLNYVPINYNTSAVIKTSEVVTSTDPNAYVVSDTPDAEGWYYEKLPDIQMYPPLGRFISSSYIGTGTYGSSNLNVINLPFNPKMVIISQSDGFYLGILINSSSTGKTIIGSSAHSTLTVTWGDKQVLWYASSIANQLNTSGKTYNYIALGNL